MIHMRLVIKIGGSLSIGKDGPKKEYFSRLLPVLKDLDKNNQLIISIGGGKFIRKYYKAVEKLNLTPEQMEWIAIELLRVNVRFLSFLLNKNSIFTLQEMDRNTSGVIGGIRPGRSTDANAAYAAGIIGADYFIKLTNVNGIYDKDPKRFKNAKKMDDISFSQLEKYASDGKPGKYGVLDRLAIETIVKHRIKTVVMNGKDPKNLLRLLNGEKIGTLIQAIPPVS